jgi:hypothetical protein
MWTSRDGGRGRRLLPDIEHHIETVDIRDVKQTHHEPTVNIIKDNRVENIRSNLKRLKEKYIEQSR